FCQGRKSTVNNKYTRIDRKRSININTLDRNGNTALSIVAKIRDEDKILLNYQQMQTISENFIRTIIKGNITQLKKLLNTSPVNGKYIVELLLKQPNIDVNLHNNEGDTALHYAGDDKKYNNASSVIMNIMNQLKMFWNVSYIKTDPFRGFGKMERLTRDLEGLYSRRINKQNRIMYEVDGEKVIFKSCM
ncbi:hypothetical protein PIROE2DRAFT_12005, partial [Piromyces sp. E2]